MGWGFPCLYIAYITQSLLSSSFSVNVDATCQVPVTMSCHVLGLRPEQGANVELNTRHGVGFLTFEGDTYPLRCCECEKDWDGFTTIVGEYFANFPFEAIIGLWFLKGRRTSFQFRPVLPGDPQKVNFWICLALHIFFTFQNPSLIKNMGGLTKIWQPEALAVQTPLLQISPTNRLEICFVLGATPQTTRTYLVPCGDVNLNSPGLQRYC